MNDIQKNLFSVAAGSIEQGAEPGAELGVAARCLSCIADVLVCMAGRKGGLRSGPAANEAWSCAYRLLEEGNLRAGVHALATQRELWLSRWASCSEFHFVLLCWWMYDDLCYRPLQAGPPGAGCTALRRRRTGASTAGCDVLTEVHLHWAGRGPAH